MGEILSLLPLVTRFYGLTPEEQLSLPYSLWVLYVREIPRLRAEEMLALLTVLEPVIVAVYTADSDRDGRRRGMEAIDRVIKRVRGIADRAMSNRLRREARARLTEEETEQLTRQLDALLSDPSLSGRIVYRSGSSETGEL